MVLASNDLQPVAQRLCPAVTQALKWLESARVAGPDDRFRQCGVCMMPQDLVLQPAIAGWQVRMLWQFGCSSPCGLGTQRRLIGWQLLAVDPCRGVAKLVKALDFDSSMRRFESFLPCQIRSARGHERTGTNVKIAGTSCRLRRLPISWFLPAMPTPAWLPRLPSTWASRWATPR
jgi:hypothetical protein